MWNILIYILLLSLYILAAKKIRRLPQVPLGLLICYLILLFSQKALAGYEWSGEWIRYIGIAADIFIAWGVARIVFWLFMGTFSLIKNEDDIPPKITRDFVQFIAFVILFMIVLRVKSDINLASLLTTSAVITVVIGLAVQATLNNFFSGLTIQAERPFTIGDWIGFDGTEGRVMGISWKSTQLLTRDQVLVYIPNSILASSTFINFSKPNRKKIVRIFIGLEYGVPYNKVKQVILDVVKEHPKVLDRPRPRVRLFDYGDFAITYEIRLWHNNYANEPQLKADINQQLWYALRRNNIRIPFPIRDVFHGHVERGHMKKQSLSLRTEARAIMETIPILTPLSDEEMTDLAGSVSIELFGEGERIVKEGEDGDSMYIIRSGACEATQIMENGKIKLLSKMHQGDFFGEISLLTGEKRSATITAVQDTSLIVIKKQIFSKFIVANPVISEQIAEVVVKRRQNQGIDVDDVEKIQVTSKKLIDSIKEFFGA